MSDSRAEYAEAGQDHVLIFYDSLGQAERAAFDTQLKSISPSKVNMVYAHAVAAAATPSDDVLAPPPTDSFDSIVGKPELAELWNEIGLEAIRQGQVGVLLMAGGQGSRLGSSAPKGCYDIGLPSHKSLFQLQAERISRLQVIAGRNAIVPWYIMTSGPTRAPTEQFFKDNNYFGLASENVVFFEQGVLPCLSNEGKILLEAPGRIAVAPDGNGGIYAGLRSPLLPSASTTSTTSTTVLSDLASRGVIYLHAYCVDNCLVRVADPIFLGYCIEKEADCGVKVVKKTVPEESVGVVALKGGKFGVVEYSEIPVDESRKRDEDGSLTFRAANVANHFYTLNFLTSVASFEDQMAYHIASKKISHVDLENGSIIKPTKPNGIKLELFVFDVFPFTQNMAILEVERSTDFSPLKNASGTGADDPETSRRDLLAEQKRWLIRAGVTIAEGVEVELSPLVSYAGEGLDSLKGQTFNTSGVVEKMNDFAKLY